MTRSTSPHVRLETQDRVRIITLNRPDKKNALTVDMYSATAHALRAAGSDSSIRVVVVTGANGVFTGGNDLADFRDDPPPSRETPAFEFLNALLEARKPLVAAVAGPAIGIGTTMLLHCDLVYAAKNATFRLPFVDLGLCPEAGSSYLLPRIAGQARAAELFLLGEVFDAAYARELGLVTRVVPDRDLWDHSLTCAKELARKPPGAVRLSKDLLKRGHRAAVREAMEVEGTAFLKRLRSPEAAEAFRAFFGQRPPDFSEFD